jgi:hypothetical protein
MQLMANNSNSCPRDSMLKNSSSCRGGAEVLQVAEKKGPPETAGA